MIAPTSSPQVPGRPTFRVLPQATEDSRALWTGGEHGQLRIHHCRSCTRYFHPPVGSCFRCRSTDVGPQAVSGRATVAAFTVNHHPWFAGFPPPYVVAIVELEEEPDVRLTTNIIDCAIEDVTVGMAVEVTFDHFDDVWIPLFRPVSV